MRDTITSSLKDAMKAGDKARVSAVRLIQAAIKDKDIELRGLGKGQATNEDLLSLLQKMVKQRQESIAIYQSAGRQDLVDSESAELAVISGFLPRQMDEAATAAAVREAVAETGAAGMKDMGKVVAALKARYTGQMDFARASQLVKAALSG